MARERTYTPSQLRKASDRYLRAISRVVAVQEEYDTGEVDERGHPVKARRPALTEDGKEVLVREFLEPPRIGALCQALGIHRSTWYRYASGDDPDMREVCEGITAQIQDYLEREMLLRPGKEIKGVQIMLERAFGMGQRQREDASCGVVVLPAILADGSEDVPGDDGA